MIAATAISKMHEETHEQKCKRWLAYAKSRARLTGKDVQVWMPKGGYFSIRYGEELGSKETRPDCVVDRNGNIIGD
jgi:hypothetical protein